jgi:hypothetical protein
MIRGPPLVGMALMVGEVATVCFPQIASAALEFVEVSICRDISMSRCRYAAGLVSLSLALIKKVGFVRKREGECLLR